ncbi:MAG TPA: transporter [Methylomirabilota bacterium]|nr:transporter [Methylomirabilota bacterium]
MEQGKSADRRKPAFRFVIGIMLLVFLPHEIFAGPPFVTDDPEPVDYQHWEFYIASQHTQTADGWSGTAPHIEINYGTVSNLQLHLIAPMAYNAPDNGSAHYGYGDTELGAKFRFIQETEKLPQIGIFPLLEIPTGSEADGFGSGHWQAFLPVWAQKSFGDWKINGGGGYGINSGAGNENWEFVGTVVQKQITKSVLLGAEIYHRTTMETGGRDDTAFNLGTVIDFSQHQHFLFTAGRSINGPTEFQTYIALQFTFGP